MFIDKETLQRVNIQAPYKGRSRLDTPEIRAELGIVEVSDPVPDEDVSTLTHYVQEVDYPPYLVCTLKSQQQVVQALNGAAQEARRSAYLNETDPLFFKEQRGEVPPGTWHAAVLAVQQANPKYPEVPDVESNIDAGA